MMKTILKKFPSLERYNQMLWALIGSGVVLVVLVSLLAIAAAMIYSLFSVNKWGMPVAVLEEGGEDGAARKVALYDFCLPLAIQDTRFQLIRVVSDQFSVRKVSKGFSSNASYESYSDTSAYGACSIHGSNLQAGMVNVIIRDMDSNSMHLLLKENAVIQTLEYPQPSARENGVGYASAFPSAGTLYLEMGAEDGNKDGVIDERDDLGAYLSDLDGKNLDRITPVPSRVLEKTYDKKRNILSLRILRDTNNDHVLDELDKPALIDVNVKNHKILREVLDAKSLTDLLQQAEPKRKIE